MCFTRISCSASVTSVLFNLRILKKTIFEKTNLFYTELRDFICDKAVRGMGKRNEKVSVFLLFPGCFAANKFSFRHWSTKPPAK